MKLRKYYWLVEAKDDNKPDGYEDCIFAFNTKKEANAHVVHLISERWQAEHITDDYEVRKVRITEVM